MFLPIGDYVCGGPVLGKDILKENLCELWGIYVGPHGDEVGHFGELVYYYQYRVKSFGDQ